MVKYATDRWYEVEEQDFHALAWCGKSAPGCYQILKQVDRYRKVSRAQFGLIK
jgi:hypothetical protein